jgi:cytochrome c biogenesis protein CcdA
MTIAASPPPSTPASPARGGTRGLVAQGYPRSFLIGSAFSIAWSPCIGPILGVVLTLAATSGTAGQGALLLLAYALGLGVWFIAFGAFFGWIAPRLQVLKPHLQTLMVVSGGLFILVGALMVLGEFQRLNNYFVSFGFFFSETAGAEQDLTGGLDGALGPGVAFFGGLVSFLSPCVLPLVPAYLVNIAGEAVLSGAQATTADRRRVLRHSIAFVVGFALVFTVLGASVGFVGSLLTNHIETMTQIGGAVMMLFGMQISGLIHLPYLDRTYQISVD